jgi:hypothetical protein
MHRLVEWNGSENHVVAVPLWSGIGAGSQRVLTGENVYYDPTRQIGQAAV